MADRTLKIEGMHCHHCVMALEKSFKMVDGIEHVDVEVGKAALEFDSARVTDRDITEAVQRAGFKVLEQ